MAKSNVLSIPGPETITRVTLKNGIVILVYENHSAQSVVIAGSLRAGGIYETADQNGLASMTASSLMLGTAHRDFDSINSSLEDIGADLDFSAGAHKVGFSAKALAEDLPILIELLGDCLRHPVFPAHHVERRRGETLTWLQYRQQDTRWQASRLFREALYPPQHPYHYSVRGTLETIPLLTLEDMRGFYQRHYGPDALIIAVVGAVRAGEVVDTVRQHFEDWRNPDQPAEPPLPEMAALSQQVRSSLVLSGKTQSDLMLGTFGPSRFAEDYQAANLANSILGQFGMMGRIGDAVRERAGLAYYASSRLEGGYGPGAWSISAGVNPANVEKAIDLCLVELRRITTEPVSAEDLDDNKAYYTGRLPLQLESNEGIAGTLLSMESYKLGIDYLVNYRELIYQLTAEDLLAAAQRYLNPDALVIALAGPAALS